MNRACRFPEGAVVALTELTGREITRLTVSYDEWPAGLIFHGVPESGADLIGLFAASRKGEFAKVDPTLERLLGRPPLSMRDALAARISS